MRNRLSIISALFMLTTQFTGCYQPEECTFVPFTANANAEKNHRSQTRSIPETLGVNIGFTDPRPGEVKMIRDAGFRWIRMDLKWDATEREKGKYDFSAYDGLLASLKSSDVRALLILDYGNPLYDNGLPPRSESARKGFARWAVAAAKHFQNRQVLWEIYNEPNHPLFWPPQPNVNEYIALAVTVGRAFREEVPEEQLIGPATSEIDFPFVEACFKAGLLNYWSAVSVHPYRRGERIAPVRAAGGAAALRGAVPGLHRQSAEERAISRSGAAH